MLNIQKASHTYNQLMTFCALLTLLAIASCKSTPLQTKKQEAPNSVLQRTMDVYGNTGYDSCSYGFTFRNNVYTFKYDGDNYEYTRLQIKDKKMILDVMANDQIHRTIDGSKIELTEKDRTKHRESINSVIYFATLPHKLNDPAVNVVNKPDVEIKGKSYNVLQISFDEENGGQDFDDLFYYWIDKNTGFIDYLGYQYATNGGGVRFREARNRRAVGGITFQDYINYKADVKTTLPELPALFEAANLTRLSVIANIDMEVIK